MPLSEGAEERTAERMTADKLAKLVRMANQIGDFYAAMPADEATAGAVVASARLLDGEHDPRACRLRRCGRRRPEPDRRACGRGDQTRRQRLTRLAPSIVARALRPRSDGIQRRHREEPAGRRGDPGERRTPYVPLDRHASLAMTASNLHAPRRVSSFAPARARSRMHAAENPTRRPKAGSVVRELAQRRHRHARRVGGASELQRAAVRRVDASADRSRR